MTGSFKNCKIIIAFAIIACVPVGCAGKSDVSRVDIQKQAFDDLRSEIRAVIGDPDRESEAIELLDSLEGELTALHDKLLARQTRARQLNANYDTTRAEFDAFFEQANVEIRLHRQRAGDNHRAILELTTPEEWSQISAARTRAMKTFIKSSLAI